MRAKPRWKSIAEFLVGGVLAVTSFLSVSVRAMAPLDVVSLVWIVCTLAAGVILARFAGQAWEEI